MGSTITYFGPAPNGTICFSTRIEDSDSGRVSLSQRNIKPQPDVFGISWAELVAAGWGIIDQPEDGPATIRRGNRQSKEAETRQ